MAKLFYLTEAAAKRDMLDRRSPAVLIRGKNAAGRDIYCVVTPGLADIRIKNGWTILAQNAAAAPPSTR